MGHRSLILIFYFTIYLCDLRDRKKREEKLLGKKTQHCLAPPWSTGNCHPSLGPWTASRCLLTNSSFNPCVCQDHEALAKRLLCPLLQQLLASIIGIISLVVHYQLVVHEIEAVRAGLIRVFDHQTNDIL